MNVQRQENNEQQCCNTDDASEFVRFGGKRRQHVEEFSPVDLSMSTNKTLKHSGHKRLRSH